MTRWIVEESWPPLRKDGGREDPAPADFDPLDMEETWRSLADSLDGPMTLDPDRKGIGRVDRYELLEKLGQGGFGAVYGAKDTEANILVALKALPAEVSCDADEMAAIRDNFSLVSRLHHPNIASVLHLHKVESPDSRAAQAMGIKRGDYLVVMEYAPGATLFNWRRAAPDGKLPFEQVIGICRRIAEALDYAHSQRVLHRDIKPKNIMLAHNISEDRDQKSDSPKAQSLKSIASVKVLDFGLAAEIRSSMSRKSKELKQSTSGTPNYMAPEQWQGLRQGPATDQYALAVLVYELLDGEVPFKSAHDTGNIEIMRHAVCNNPVESIPGLTKAQNAVLLRALSKEPGERFGSCGEFVAALGGGRFKPRNTQKTRKSSIGNRQSAMLIGLGVCLAGLIAGGIYLRNVAAEKSAVKTQQSSIVNPQSAMPTSAVEVRFSVKPAGARVSVFSDRGVVTQGQTDAQGLFTAQLAPGRYEIEAQLDGYEFYKSVLPVSEASTQEIELVPLRGALTVLTTPGAEVTAKTASGKTIRLGKADDKGELRYERLVEGDYELTMSHKDYESSTARISIATGRPQQVREILKGKPGSIYISASPQAGVWVDGVRRGGTGEQITGLEPGERQVEVRLSGFRTERFALEVPPNAQAPRKVLGNLVRESGSVRIEAQVPDFAREFFNGAGKRVRIGEGAWKSVTELPYIEEGAACEEHEVRLEVAGFKVEPAVVRSQVEDQKTATARFTLSPEPARLTVESNASGAEVFDAEGKRLGAAGTAFDVPSLQQVGLVVKAKGYADRTVSLKAMEPGKGFRYEVTLEEQRAPTAGNMLGMAFVEVKAGSFMMGSNDGRDNEKPVRRVTITRDFWMGKFEVTQRQYQRFVKEAGYDGRKDADSYYLKHFGSGSNMPTDDRHPVVWVSWNNAVKFCEWLTQHERQAGRLPTGLVYRLPTEAEWEYAARGGHRETDTTYAGSNDINAVAWHSGNSQSKTQRVGTKAPNELGLHDMSGNVWEWVHDRYQNSYSGLGTTDPSGPSSGSSRVVRGGSWFSGASNCRVAGRNGSTPTDAYSTRGFRVVVAAPVQ